MITMILFFSNKTHIYPFTFFLYRMRVRWIVNRLCSCIFARIFGKLSQLVSIMNLDPKFFSKLDLSVYFRYFFEGICWSAIFILYARFMGYRCVSVRPLHMSYQYSSHFNELLRIIWGWSFSICRMLLQSFKIYGTDGEFHDISGSETFWTVCYAVDNVLCGIPSVLGFVFLNSAFHVSHDNVVKNYWRKTVFEFDELFCMKWSWW